jgi:cobalt-zinc-cadmium resistance protein CzcA
MHTIPGVADLGLFRVIGQPNLQFDIDRKAAGRYGLSVSDVQDAVETAVGGKAVTQVLDGEQRYDLVVRYDAPYRDTKEAIERIRMVAPSGERVSLAQLCHVGIVDGASEIYRENNSRYVALKYSVVGRDLGSTVEEAIAKVGKQVKLPVGYKIDWAGEYESAKRSQRRLAIVVPITLLVICFILYTMFSSVKWVMLIIANVAMAPIGGLLALLFTGTHFSVSSGVGFLALFGVSVQTGVIMLEYINQLRARGETILNAATPAHHDDDACGQSGPAPGGALARHRVRLAAPVRHRHCGRAGSRAYPRCLFAADALCVGRGRSGRDARG